MLHRRENHQFYYRDHQFHRQHHYIEIFLSMSGLIKDRTLIARQCVHLNHWFYYITILQLIFLILMCESFNEMSKLIHMYMLFQVCGFTIQMLHTNKFTYFNERFTHQS